MKVSVAIATYNRAAYVRQAIESVLSQTLKDCELIVVDDGSTDNTFEAITEYHDQIRYVRTENGGPARARNVGMALSRGEYICWLDSDDLFHPEKLALQCAVLDAFPDIGMVYTDCTAFDDHGMRKEFYLRTYHESAFGRGGVTFDNLFDKRILIREINGGSNGLARDSNWNNSCLYAGKIFDRYLTATVVFTSSMLFRRSLYETVGPQQPRFGFFHDLEFALRLTRGLRVGFLDVPTYEIRIHPDQISTKVGPRAPWILIRKQQDLLRVLRCHGMRDRTYFVPRRHSIEKQYARLCRAVAVPMLGFTTGSAHQSRYFPRRARTYLRQAKRFGYPQLLLLVSSYLPHWPRRLLMKLESIIRQFGLGRLA